MYMHMCMCMCRYAAFLWMLHGHVTIQKPVRNEDGNIVMMTFVWKDEVRGEEGGVRMRMGVMVRMSVRMGMMMRMGVRMPVRMPVTVRM